MNKLHQILSPQEIVIQWANVKQIRARRVVSRSNSRPTGKYPSWKMGRMMQWDSKPESNAFRWLDANPEVLSFNEQPCVIHYVLDGEKHRHFPDILVTTRHGQELWEIKPKKNADQLEVVQRTEHLTNCLSELGYGYRIVHAESLVVEPQLRNIKWLLRLGRNPVDALCKERIRLLFKESQYISWKLINNKELATDFQLARLFLEGFLDFALDQQINEETLISIKSPTGELL